ncbi:PREDICTED: uncharacterized protein LOC101379006 [Odobenus rosmarus divergens]|uniref:Uncharacterized protein LOC101379006 n=1 Tax=Odobenus rosmarus divergens TaxID=9708 RepID=A0A9B0M3W1_ODORO
MAASFLGQSEAPSQQVDSPVDMASAPEAPERPSVPVPSERLAEASGTQDSPTAGVSSSVTESEKLYPCPCPITHEICVCGHLSRPVLTWLPSLSAALEATDGLTCTLSRDVGVGGSDIYWIQQRPGSPPREGEPPLRFSSDSDKHQGSGVPGRFSGSKDTSANGGLLRVLGLQAEDEADSYCNTGHGSPYMDNVLQNLGEVRLKPPQCSLCMLQSPLPCLVPRLLRVTSVVISSSSFLS